MTQGSSKGIHPLSKKENQQLKFSQKILPFHLKKNMWEPLNIALVCPIFMRIKILSSWKDWHQEGTNEYSH